MPYFEWDHPILGKPFQFSSTILTLIRTGQKLQIFSPFVFAGQCKFDSGVELSQIYHPWPITNLRDQALLQEWSDSLMTVFYHQFSYISYTLLQTNHTSLLSNCLAASLFIMDLTITLVIMKTQKMTQNLWVHCRNRSACNSLEIDVIKYSPYLSRMENNNAGNT